MTGINITNKKDLRGRNKTPHVSRKCQMPPENQEEHDRVMGLPRGDHISERKYKIRVNGKWVYEPECIEKKEVDAPKYLNRRFKDDVKKGKWF
jgi:hypothetical protein